MQWCETESYEWRPTFAWLPVRLDYLILGDEKGLKNIFCDRRYVWLEWIYTKKEGVCKYYGIKSRDLRS